MEFVFTGKPNNSALAESGVFGFCADFGAGLLAKMGTGQLPVVFGCGLVCNVGSGMAGKQFTDQYDGHWRFIAGNCLECRVFLALAFRPETFQLERASGMF